MKLILPFDLRNSIVGAQIVKRNKLHKLVHNTICRMVQTYPSGPGGEGGSTTPPPTPDTPAPGGFGNLFIVEADGSLTFVATVAEWVQYTLIPEGYSLHSEGGKKYLIPSWIYTQYPNQGITVRA